MGTFMEAYRAAITGKVVKSAVTEKHYALKWGFLKDVLTGRSPLIDEFIGGWEVTEAVYTDTTEDMHECSSYTPLQ